jgi:poly-gamma-glutamate synthesis protein (capsule biosynthesis protein)
MGLKICAVGDIMLGEQPLCNNFGVKEIIRKNGADFLFEEFSSLFCDADIVFGNLECSIREENSDISKKPIFFCAEPDAINGLVNAHFNVLSVANNHIMENGHKIFFHTVRCLKSNGIAPVGLKENIDIINIKGYRVAFLAYSFIEDFIADVCYNKITSEESIFKDILRAKPISDIVIVSLHWGREYIPHPSPDQIRIGRSIVDAGADIILGGHPHVPQSYEIYRNRPIFYSLGNFIFDDAYISITQESFIAEITIGDSIETLDVTIHPFVINRDNYKPKLVAPLQTDATTSIMKIRTLLEDESLLDYERSIGDYNLLHKYYNRAAKWDMKVQFIKNFFRYSTSVKFNTIKQYLGKQRGKK